MRSKARERYERLQGARTGFLDTAVKCSELTLPYLIRKDESVGDRKVLVAPWQSVGSKAVVTLAAKLMLALLPPQTTFFKLQIRDEKIGTELPVEIRSELDLSFSKMERMIMDFINASSDRVVVHQALKHLIVGGNALIYMGKDGLKHYPLNRYVVNRDGNGNVCEIVTKERVHKQLLEFDLPEPPQVGGDKGQNEDEVEVYTYVYLDKQSGRWVWHQEVNDTIIPGSRSTAPKNASPWLVLRFNSVDGEDYGRGRVEEFYGDLKSLEALSQALVEGSAAMAKVVFLVSPSSTTKPASLAAAGTGAIIQGRPDDVAVVTTGGKTGDFQTAQQMATALEARINDAFLILNIRQSERTTAEEVRMTQMELEQQLGGIFSLLTVEFLIPYLNRIMLVLQRNNTLPKIDKSLVRPQIVAGVNALGRGQDRESLTTFITTIAQTLGPEALMQHVDATEAIKRLAAAQGIDYLNLVKSAETMDAEAQAQQESAQQQALVQQAGSLASAPLMDPSKNPALTDNNDQQFSEAGPAEEALDG